MNKPPPQRSRQYLDFVGHYLPDPNLQGRLNEQIGEQDARKIAKSMTQWEIKLAGPLGLTRQEIEDLNEEERRPQIRRYKVPS